MAAGRKRPALAYSAYGAAPGHRPARNATRREAGLTFKRMSFWFRVGDESQVAREFYAAFLGEHARFQVHPASKQSVFALVSAGFGITFAMSVSHSEAGFVGVVFKRIHDPVARRKCHGVASQLHTGLVLLVAFLRDDPCSRSLAGEGSSAAELGEGAVRRHEAFQHGDDQPRGVGRLVRSPSEHLGVGDEVAMNGSGEIRWSA